MDDKKKKFVIPDAEVVDFAMEDIITESLNTEDAECAWGEGVVEEWS